MKVLVIGAGQIGDAIRHIIAQTNHEVHIRDIADYPLSNVDVLHICYPDSRTFVKDTKAYIATYQPKMTIIHSSVSVGTTQKCGTKVVHVPVRGRHPNLAEQIPAFPLFVGGFDKQLNAEAVAYLEGCNLVACDVGDPMGTELVKLLSNIHMGLEIAWRQEVKRLLEYFAINPLVYERWEDSYNEGYRMTGDEQLTRPRLKPDPIGGHCILECTKILADQIHSKVFEFILESNEKEKAKRNGHRETVKA